MRPRTPPPTLRSGLVAACDDPALFGVSLTPLQRERLQEIETGNLLHVWALGRRSGKGLLGSLTGLWTNLLRPDLDAYVRRREKRYAVCLATNLRQGRIFVDQAKSIVEASPLLAGLVDSATDDEIVFKNGTVLAAFPCTSRGGRGWPIAFLMLDEAVKDGKTGLDATYDALKQLDRRQAFRSCVTDRRERGSRRRARQRIRHGVWDARIGHGVWDARVGCRVRHARIGQRVWLARILLRQTRRRLRCFSPCGE